MPDTPDSLRSASGDPLLDCLVELTRLHQRPMSAAALRAGLPTDGSRLTPQLFARAAERAGFTARVVERPLDRVPAEVLPAVLLLDGGRRACVLTALHEDGAVDIIDPADGASPKRMARAALASAYTGIAIFAQPEHRLDDRAGDVDSFLQRSWFWGTLYRYRRDYGQVLLA